MPEIEYEWFISSSMVPSCFPDQVSIVKVKTTNLMQDSRTVWFFLSMMDGSDSKDRRRVIFGVRA